MSRTPVSNKNSIRVITILVALIMLLTIWPMRLYHRTISYVGGKVTQISDPVTESEDAGEYFTAQYDHIDSIEVYVESAEEGQYLTAQIFDQTGGTNTQIALEKVSFPMGDLPGYVSIPLDVDVTPGTVYVLILSGKVDNEASSTFRVGFESAEEAAANPAAPIYNIAFHNDTGISGLALAMRVHYDEPLTKTQSALAGGIVLLIAALALTLQYLYYKRRPAAERLVPLMTVLQYALTPVIAIPAVVAAIAVFPLRLYDSRVLDVLTYEAGIIIAAVFLLYGLWHNRIGIQESLQSVADILTHAREILMILDIAWIMLEACTYMNAVNDYVHHDCEARIIIGLVLLILLLGKVSWVLNLWTILTAIVSLIVGSTYVHQEELRITSAGEVRELAEQMANVTSKAVSYGFLAVAAVSVLVMLREVRRERRHNMAGRSGLDKVLCALFAAFLVWTVVCRNERSWLLTLAAVWTLLYLRYAYSGMREHSERWLRVISYGILLHFICSVVWTMLHRYYLAYNYSRFSMQFHTVTVTAYYLLIVSAAALALFLSGYRRVYDLPRKERLRHLWKEYAILGMVCSYMVMSMTRAGVYSLAVMVLVGIVCTFAHGQQPLRRMGRTLGTIVLVTVLTFPSMFTGQRIISTTVASPVIYEPVEEYYDTLLRHTPWNSTDFMNIEIFIRDSMDRLIGGGIGSRIYYTLRWNIPQGYDTASVDAVPAAAVQVAAEDAAQDILADSIWFTASGSESPGALWTDLTCGVTHRGMVAAVSDEVIANITTGSYGGGDFSNGRTDIWRAYIAEMNLTGHVGMDLEMPNGEIAIHAHNILVQMSYDCGILAGILFALVLLVTLIGSWLYYRRHRSDAASLLPLLLMIGFGITGMVEWIYQFDNPYTIVFLLILAPIMLRDHVK